MRSLRYHTFNYVFMQVFTLPANFSDSILQDREIPGSIFDTIYAKEDEANDIRRYHLGTHDFTIKQLLVELLDASGLADAFSGKMEVELTTYFNRFAVVRYYLPFDSKQAGNPLSTEQLISLWDIDQEDGGINVALSSGVSFPTLMRQYHAELCNGSCDLKQNRFYRYFDIGKCTDEAENAITQMVDSDDLHLTNEMHGLLTHHYEWHDIRAEYGKKINSENIASTTDELIMLNEECCTAILNNIWIDPSDRALAQMETTGIIWKSESHQKSLQEKEGSIWSLRWPELSVLVETALIQRYILSMANKALKSQSHTLLESSTKAVTYNYVERAINQNVELRLLIANAISRFEELPEVNLRNTQESIRTCFGIDSETLRAKTKMQYNDKALAMLSDSNRLHQARQLNIVLAILSAASMMGLLFTQIKSPFVQRVFSVSDYYAELAGIAIISLSIIIMTICLIIVFRNQRNA